MAERIPVPLQAMHVDARIHAIADMRVLNTTSVLIAHTTGCDTLHELNYAPL